MQVTDAGVGFLGRAESDLEPARPDPAPVHTRVGASHKRILARFAEIALRIEPSEVPRGVQLGDFQPGVRFETLLLRIAGTGFGRACAFYPRISTGHANLLRRSWRPETVALRT